MHQEVEELRSKLKEVLYDCAVDIRATKAALYLLDPAIRKFELAAEFGFRSAIRQSATFNDPLIDRCQRGRTPFFVNSVGADPRLSDLMFDAASERLMAVPLYSRGQLIGVIDMRDKVGKQPFEQADVTKAQAIADKILNLFAAKNIWNQRFITLSEDGSMPKATMAPAPAPAAPAPRQAAPLPSSAPPIAAAPTPFPSAPPPTSAAPSLQQGAPPPRERPREPAQARPNETAMQIVVRAGNAASKLISSAGPEPIADVAMTAARDVLRTIVALPGVALVSFAVAPNNLQEIASRGPVSEDAARNLHAKLSTWLTKRGESVGALKTSVQVVAPGLNATAITSAQMQKVFTAPVASTLFRGLYLTVAFSENPDRATHELLAALLTQLQLTVDEMTTRESLQRFRSRAASKLVEPDFESFPDLRRHSEAVAARSAAFAQFLGLTSAEVETVTLTALVHDVGMRVLDYDRLYRKRDLSADELALLREHAAVGAVMVQPLLGNDVARAVLSHHERVDGRGYPHELQGEDIPLASRVVQICDAYVAITDPATYQPVETQADALAAIARGAGAQFDTTLANKFSEMVKVS